MATTFRPGTGDDDPGVYELFRDSLEDLLERMGMGSGRSSPAERRAMWDGLYGSLFAHLTATAEAFVVAERDDVLLGYARTTNRAGLRELTELFVAPGAQAAGVGRELLARAFPAEGAERLLIIATLDSRAQARYLRSGTYPHCPVLNVHRAPEPIEVPGTLEAVPLDGAALDPVVLGELARVDESLLGHRRDVDHRWLLSDRAGFLFRRRGDVAGYGYVGETSGPVAVLDERDMAPALAHLEAAAASLGVEHLAFDVPGASTAALSHLVERGFRVDRWVVLLMSDEPLGGLDRYVASGPTFFL